MSKEELVELFKLLSMGRRDAAEQLAEVISELLEAKKPKKVKE